MNRTRMNWVAIGVTALVLLNIGLMASIWLNRDAKVANARTGRPERGGPGALIIRELGFDSLQRLRFDSLRNDHHSSVESYRSQMRELKERFFSGISHNEPPSDSLAAALANLQVRIDRTTYEHFRQVRALCTEEQKEKFDRIIERVMAQMGAPHPRREGPPGAGHPDGPPAEGPMGEDPDGPGPDHEP